MGALHLRERCLLPERAKVLEAVDHAGDWPDH